MPTAVVQLKSIRTEALSFNDELSDELLKVVDKDKLIELIGKDNASIALKGPGQLANILTFSGTLRTSNGLPDIEHNHQEYSDGKYVSKTDTHEAGTSNIKLWKLIFRAFDDRGGGLIASFNSDRKELN